MILTVGEIALDHDICRLLLQIKYALILEMDPNARWKLRKNSVPYSQDMFVSGNRRARLIKSQAEDEYKSADDNIQYVNAPMKILPDAMLW